ncbi:uncharacterized protein LOC115632801 [Scaptodrosophila lebanonensis]|uniref:Uncharacterized protein LOC115632801 n=1 Tax=Drosophila lebanonensis TaxID=7225 RepID=A0A6J2UFM9_DROLE|nr:uncharacterized protein LOC115632801 [Scaptodrosophila lebanonensis]
MPPLKHNELFLLFLLLLLLLRLLMAAHKATEIAAVQYLNANAKLRTICQVAGQNRPTNPPIASPCHAKYFLLLYKLVLNVMRSGLVVLLCLLGVACLPHAIHSKHHRQQKREEHEEDRHYLPPDPKEEKEELEKPFYKQEKHTSERIVYHKHDYEPRVYHSGEHHEPKKQRVDHYHHYDKKPEVKTTKHVHYTSSTPKIRTDYNRDLFTPAVTQTIYRRGRPHRVTIASAPHSVFHTQINVQSQDSELNAQFRPDPPIIGAPNNNPAGAQLPANAFPPGGGQLPSGASPGCQFPLAGNAAAGCAFPGQNPTGAQHPASALAPSNNFPTNTGFLPGQLAVQGNGQPPRKLFRHHKSHNDNVYGPALGAQFPIAQAPISHQPISQVPADQAPLAQFPNRRALDAQLPLAQQAIQAPVPGTQHPAAQFPTSQPPTDQLRYKFDPKVGAQQPTEVFPTYQAPGTQLPQPSSGRRNRPNRNRSNYQGLNVLGGNVLGQPHLQGPANVFGNRQDTNIIGGNFYSDADHYGKQRQLVAFNGNQRSVFLTDDVDDESVGDIEDTEFGGAASTPEVVYTTVQGKKVNKNGSKPRSQHRSDLNTAASSLDYTYNLLGASSEHDTDYREDGYHYEKPKRAFEF